MLFKRRLATFMLITAVFYCSVIESSKSYDCSFSGIPQEEVHRLSFTEIFQIALASNDDLMNQFNVSLPPQETYNIIHQDSIIFYTIVNAKYPQLIADELAQTVQYKLLGAPPQAIAYEVSKSVQSILKEQGVLNKGNTITLALKFVDYFNSIRDSPNYDGSPASNINSIYQSILNLVQDFFPNAPNNGEVIGKTFINNFDELPDRVTHAPAVNDIFMEFDVDVEI